MVREGKRKEKCVYVIGAGFSAGLDFPLVHDLLVRLWPRLPSTFQKKLQKVIAFHHPGFDPCRRTSFPTIEHLLSEMMVNEQLFDASRPAEGSFKHKELLGIRQELLLSIAQWFHEIHKKVLADVPDWLRSVVNKIKDDEATVISFNWDLVLDQIMFEDNLSADAYGLSQHPTKSCCLLKPHGSLNWFEGDQAKFLPEEKCCLLSSTQQQSKMPVFAFKPYRAPRSKQRIYMPMIVPPVYAKTFEQPIFYELWRRSVAALSVATKIVFLGYSLPDADLHARFILRCGFHNQVEGEIVSVSSRTSAPGPANVVVVNPDAGSARRIEAAVGGPVLWEPMTVQKWVKK